MRRMISGLVLCGAAALSGCHSHYIQATLTNHSGGDINVVQVDYPGASFGTQSIAPAGQFRYRFKLLGSGNIKISWTDASRNDHTQTGPRLNEGQEGTLEIDFRAQTAATFHTSLTP